MIRQIKKNIFSFVHQKALSLLPLLGWQETDSRCEVHGTNTGGRVLFKKAKDE